MDIKDITNGALLDEVNDTHSAKRAEAYTELIRRMDAVQVKDKKGFDTPTILPPVL